jgi:ABC-type phosphate transport system permease subunit
MIFSALVKLAALIVLLLLGGIIVSLIFSSWPSIQKFGFSFCGPKSGMRRTKSLVRWCRFTARW